MRVINVVLDNLIMPERVVRVVGVSVEYLHVVCLEIQVNLVLSLAVVFRYKFISLLDLNNRLFTRLYFNF